VSVLPELERRDALLLDIDERLMEVIVEMEQVDEWTTALVMRFVQAAYGKGYQDAQLEPEPATLQRRHGYEIPKRRRS
jgi:hypothetical protein